MPISVSYICVGRERDRDRTEQLLPADKAIGPIVANNNNNNSQEIDIDNALGFVVGDTNLEEPLPLETLEILEDNDIVPDLQEFQYAKQYNEALLEVDPKLVAILTQFFREQEELEDQVNYALYDNSNPLVVIPYRRSKETSLSRFATALRLQYKEAAISRTNYKSLLEILQIDNLDI